MATKTNTTSTLSSNKRSSLLKLHVLLLMTRLAQFLTEKKIAANFIILAANILLHQKTSKQFCNPLVHKLPNNLEATSKFQVPERWHEANSTIRGHNIRNWPANLTVISRFLLGACELIHIFIRKEKKCNNYTENIKYNCTKFIYSGDKVPGICAPLMSCAPNIHSYFRRTPKKLVWYNLLPNSSRTHH